MSDAPDTADHSTGDGGTAERPSTVADRLLALQEIDTEADQLRTRRARLDEREDRARRAAAVEEWERRLATDEQRIVELTAIIDGAEDTEEGLEAKKARLEQQLRTVIAPREAEALMHEIATLENEIDANETAELEALEEQSQLESGLADHRAAEQGLREALTQADDALGLAVVEIDTSLDLLERRRATARDGVDAASLAAYDRLRDQLGVAVARLIGKMCGGCHLDLSAVEVEAARESAATGSGVATCPQCGRILVP